MMAIGHEWVSGDGNTVIQIVHTGTHFKVYENGLYLYAKRNGARGEKDDPRISQQT